MHRNTIRTELALITRFLSRKYTLKSPLENPRILPKTLWKPIPLLFHGFDYQLVEYQDQVIKRPIKGKPHWIVIFPEELCQLANDWSQFLSPENTRNRRTLLFPDEFLGDILAAQSDNVIKFLRTAKEYGLKLNSVSTEEYRLLNYYLARGTSHLEATLRDILVISNPDFEL